MNWFQKTATAVVCQIVKSMGRRLWDIPSGFVPPMTPQQATGVQLLYLHVPFCHARCHYCTFHRYTFEEAAVRNYFKTLRQEMKNACRYGAQFRAVYVGGGTTTLLPDELIQTLDLAHDLFPIKEVSIETSPALDEETLQRLEGKVTRLSVGLQSTHDRFLQALGRTEQYGPAARQIQNIANLVGRFPQVNVDLIFGVPGQTTAHMVEDLRTVQELGIDQISLYPLMKMESIQQQMQETMGYREFSIQEFWEFYALACDQLGERYGVSSAWTFGKKESMMLDEYVTQYRHYAGLGSGAFSYVQGQFAVNHFDLAHYTNQVNQTGFGVIAHTRIPSVLDQLYQILLNGFDGKTPQSPGLRALYRTLGITTAHNIYSDFGRFFFMMLMREFYMNMDRVRQQFREQAENL